MSQPTIGASKWIGRRLAYRYRIVGQLGAGGMADILRAFDELNKVDVVIKVPKPAMLVEPELVARFTREMRLMTHLAHPHIVRVLDVGEYDKIPFAVIEYMPKGTLRDRQPTTLDGDPVPMAPDTLLGWLPPIADVLDYIHARGFVHRDMKPDNLLFDARDRVYLADFGIVKLLDTTASKKQTVATAAGMVIGTAEYMAPELILGQAYDGRVDQYALAITVYEMLSGQVPFLGTGTAVHVKHCTKQVPPLTQLVPGLNPGIWQAVSRALQKDPGARYPNCQTMSREILAAVGASPGVSQAAAPLPLAINTVSCPECGKRCNVPAKWSGRRVRCLQCKATFEAPMQPSPDDPPGQSAGKSGTVVTRNKETDRVTDKGRTTQEANRPRVEKKSSTMSVNNAASNEDQSLPSSEEEKSQRKPSGFRKLLIVATLLAVLAGVAVFAAVPGLRFWKGKPSVASRELDDEDKPSTISNAPQPQPIDHKKAGAQAKPSTASSAPAADTPRSESAPHLIDGSKTWALVVGIGSHSDTAIPSRPSAGNDASAWAKLLLDSEYVGTPKSRLQLIVSGGDISPTRANLLGGLKRVVAQAAADDTVYIVFVGQGCSSAGRPSLICEDSEISRLEATTLTTADIEREIHGLRARRLIVFIDMTVPDSSTLREEPSSGFAYAFMQREANGDAAPGRYLISSSDVSTSKALTVGGTSILTERAIVGLRGAADTEGYEQDGVVTANELATYLNKQVIIAARAAGARDDESIPVCDAYGGLQGSFPISRNPTAAQVGEKRLLAWANLAKSGSISADFESDGRELLSVMPDTTIKQGLRKQYQSAADGSITLTELDQARSKATENSKLPRSEAERFAADVTAAAQKICEQHIKELNSSVLIAASIRGIFRHLQLTLPLDLQSSLSEAKLWSKARAMDVLVDARLQLGKRPDLDAPGDSEIAIAWMITAMGDRYTKYTDRKAVAEQNAIGEFTGIGVNIRHNRLTDAIEVMTPFKGSPAYRAGIHTGDLITEVRRDVDPRGEALKPDAPRVISTAGLTTSDLQKLLLGKEGIPVTLVVRRLGEPATRSFTIQRGWISPETVVGVSRRSDDTWDFMFDQKNKIAYIRLTQFTGNTCADLKSVIKQLRRDGMKGVVLDLRKNYGGQLSAAVQTAELFLSSGKVITVRSRTKDPDVYTCSIDEGFTDFPLAVLINGDTASGSEIVASVLQDRSRAVLVGERTFGKGCIQNISSLDCTGGSLQITTSRFFPPSDRNIDKLATSGRPEEDWGVKPSAGYEVRVIRGERRDIDDRLDKHLVIPRPGDKPPSIREGQDRQLEKALDYIRERLR
jgi:carboxyl-terminal processing protease